ncbi:MAG: FkbM family methyltransferase, partial [bacterium]
AYDCQVFAFDPTPKAKAYMKNRSMMSEKLHFQEIGLWHEEDIVRFYHHSNPKSPSYSIVNLHKTDTFVEATCKRLSTIMQENRHCRIDLLKLDIEGAEYRVLDSIVEDCLDVSIILVEFDEIHSKLYHGYRDRIKKSIHQLCDYGYTLVALRAKSNYTFVKKDILLSYLRSHRKEYLPTNCPDSVVYEPSHL